MPFYDAVLFDFGDTLFHRAGGPPLLVELSGGAATKDDAARVWDEVQQRARTPEALAKGRDLSLEAHRREWVALYRAFDVFADGLGAAVYEHEMGPAGWVPFTDVKPALQARGGREDGHRQRHWVGYPGADHPQRDRRPHRRLRPFLRGRRDQAGT